MKKTFKSACPRCFRALATPVRTRIVDLLSRGEKSVGELVPHFPLKQPTISYHLSELEKSGLLESRQRGRYVFYKLRSLCPHDKERCLLLAQK